MIQRASKIMNGVAEPQRDFVGNCRDAVDEVGHISSLRIHAAPKCVRIFPPKRIDGGVEVIEVFFGPIVFHENPVIR